MSDWVYFLFKKELKMNNNDTKKFIDTIFEDIYDLNDCLFMENLSGMEKLCIISFFNNIVKSFNNLSENINDESIILSIKDINKRNDDVYDILSNLGDEENNTEKIKNKMFLNVYFQDLQNVLYKAKKNN